MHHLSKNFSTNLKNTIRLAGSLVEDKQQLHPNHLLYALLKNKGSVGREILDIDLKSEKFKKILDQIKTPRNKPQKIILSSEAINLLEKASIAAFQYHHKYIGTEHLLFSLIKSNNKKIYNIFSYLSINTKEAEEKLKMVLKSVGKFSDITDKFNDYSELSPAATLKNASKKTPLHSFGVELTDIKNQQKIDHVVGREKEIDRLIQILARRTKNNPLLLGDPGVGKTAVVEGLAKKITNGEAPPFLFNKKIFTLDLGLLVAGTMFRGEFENRLKQIINSIKKDPNIILFIDEIHQIVGAGSVQGSLDAAGILKPALARGEIRCIGATTKEEYQKHMESDSALERRFQIINVNEPDLQKTKKILAGIKDNYEKYHGVSISEEAIEAAVQLSHRYIKDRFLPDKAIDLIDETASKIKISQQQNSANLLCKKLEDRLNKIDEQKIESILKEDFKTALELKAKELSLKEELLFLQKKEKEDALLPNVTAKDIARTVNLITSIPLLETNDDDKKLLNLESFLNKKIIGQNCSIEVISNIVRSSHFGLKSKERPLASFIFAGPSGVGKTELAKTLAEIVFGDKNSLIKIDMSEFKESFNASKLIGAPAGYVGYRESGKLTEAVKRRPYSLILFDEIEKAHPDIFNLLLQILDEGQLTDATGKIINFRNTIIVMTSNIGSDKFYKLSGMGFGKQNTSTMESNSKKEALKEIKNFFQPEFVNRLDNILIFNQLNDRHLEKIAAMELNNLKDRLKERNISLRFSPQIKKIISQYKANDKEGARIIKKNINSLIENELTKFILQKNIKNGIIKVGTKNKEIFFANE